MQRFVFHLLEHMLTSTDDAFCLAHEVLVRGHTEITGTLKQDRRL